ncbi:hypothetical protein [Pengzhenrongella sp.]|jgi:hypothetical protein|uniref:hypothetical protein n=1 Tax=Pengzhenrongella sp. TaxID=2888820 RepID=UPI002F924AFA
MPRQPSKISAGAGLDSEATFERYFAGFRTRAMSAGLDPGGRRRCGSEFPVGIRSVSAETGVADRA